MYTRVVHISAPARGGVGERFQEKAGAEEQVMVPFLTGEGAFI